MLDSINTLKENGIKIAIDDFGTGYSSIALFENVPIDVVKLDCVFLTNRRDSARLLKIFKGLTNLFKDLDITPVCEYVETEEEEELLRQCGISVAQGYLYSNPLPQSDFEKRLDCSKVKNFYDM